MIIDSLKNLHNYQNIHPSFSDVIRFFESVNIDTWQLQPNESHHPGFHLIQVLDKIGSSVSNSVLEAHNANIDIHIAVSGTETLGWKPRHLCEKPKGEFSIERDAIFFEDNPSLYFKLEKAHFVVFFPEDAHNGMIGDELISKIIVKIRM
jgi:biofilm protein TabA